jgi:hypothetical protein
LRIIGGLECEADGFQPLVDIGIGVDGPALRGGTFANEAAEIVHAAIGFKEVAHGGNAVLDVDGAAGGPEARVDADGVDRNVLEFGVRRVGKIEDALFIPGRIGGERNL